MLTDKGLEVRCVDLGVTVPILRRPGLIGSAQRDRRHRRHVLRRGIQPGDDVVGSVTRDRVLPIGRDIGDRDGYVRGCIRLRIGQLPVAEVLRYALVIGEIEIDRTRGVRVIGTLAAEHLFDVAKCVADLLRVELGASPDRSVEERRCVFGAADRIALEETAHLVHVDLAVAANQADGFRDVPFPLDVGAERDDHIFHVVVVVHIEISPIRVIQRAIGGW